MKTYCYLSHLGLASGCTVQDIYMAMEDGSIAILSVVNQSCSDAPAKDGVLVIEKQSTGKVNITFKQSHNNSVAPNYMWIGTLKGGDGSGLTWNKVLSMEEKTYVEAVVIEDVLDPIIENADILFHHNGNTGSLVNLTGQKLFCVECRKKVLSTGQTMLTQTVYQPTSGKLVATRSKNWWNSTWSDWNLLCTTKVKNVERIDVVSTNTTNFPDGTGLYYVVKNGICYVTVFNLKITNIVAGTEIEVFDGLPKSASYICQPLNAGSGTSVQTYPYPFNICVDRLKTRAYIKSGNTNFTGSLFGSFSYPVAE